MSKVETSRPTKRSILIQSLLQSSQCEKLRLQRKRLTFLIPLIGTQVFIISETRRKQNFIAPKAAEAPAAATPAPAAAPVADLLGGMSAAPSQAPAQPVQSSDNYDPFSQWEKKTPTNNNTPNAFDPMAPGSRITSYIFNN